jgi:hypothetical protein
MNNVESTTSDQSAISSRSSLSNKPRIPLAEAVSRAENWRNLVVKMPAESTSNVPGATNGIDVSKQRIFRAININIADVKDLMQDHPQAKSIRLYLSLQDPAFPYQITGMLVPVDANNHDMLTKKSVSEGLMNESEIVNSASDSTIYDFTQPCPALCDTSSPLFNSTNSLENYI